MSSRGRSSSSRPTVNLEIGNTYRKIPYYDAPLARDGKTRKDHEWTLYVKAKEGSHYIDNVKFVLHSTFTPRTFTKNMPPFATKQTSYGSFCALVKVTLCDGTKTQFEYDLAFRRGGGATRHVVELKRSHMIGRVKKAAMPLCEQTTFGIEIELSIPESSRDVHGHLLSRRVNCIHAVPSERAPAGFWKVTSDSSIRCPAGRPNCQKVEIVSPVLTGGRGLSELHHVLQVIKSLSPAVNRSMGVHVHIGLRNFSFEGIKKICQQFVKHEDTFDQIVPPSRRGNGNQYAKSNRLAPQLATLSNKEANLKIARCRDVKELCRTMCPDRYYKLNLQAYHKHGTMEFRQHSGSTAYTKLGYWVRLLVAFCNNAARLPAPKSYLESSRSNLEDLCAWVIKDGGLQRHFRKRARDLSTQSSRGSSCCQDCSESSGFCSSSGCNSSVSSFREYRDLALLFK